MRLRTSFLVSERTASLISFSCPANSPGASEVPASSARAFALTASVASLRSCLAGDRDGLGEVVGGDALDGGEHVVGVVVDGGELELLDRAVGGDHAGDELALQGDGLLDPLLARLQATGEDGLVDDLGAVGVVLEAPLRATGLDHHHGDVAVVELAAGDDELERALGALVVRRVGDPLAVLRPGDADSTDRAVERDPADHQGGRGGVDRQHVIGLLVIGAEDVGDDLRLVAEALGERRTQRPVGEAAGQDGVLGRTALPTEERAGDLADGVRALLDVDGQGEEVDARADVVGGVGRRQHGRAADGGDDGALALRGELAGLEGQRLVGTGNGTAHADGVSHEGLLSRRTFVGRILERPVGSQSAIPPI